MLAEGTHDCCPLLRCSSTVAWYRNFPKTLDSGALDPRTQTRAQFWGPSTVAWCRNLPQWCGVSLENTSCRSPPTLVLLFSSTTSPLSPHQSNEELFQQQHLCSTDTSSLTNFADMLLLSLQLWATFSKVQIMPHAISSVQSYCYQFVLSSRPQLCSHHMYQQSLKNISKVESVEC